MVDAWKILKVSKRRSRALGWEDIRDVWGYARSLEGVVLESLEWLNTSRWIFNI